MKRGDRLPEFKFRSISSIGVRERYAFAHSRPFRFSIHGHNLRVRNSILSFVPTQYGEFMRTHRGVLAGLIELCGGYDALTETPPFPESSGRHTLVASVLLSPEIRRIIASNAGKHLQVGGQLSSCQQSKSRGSLHTGPVTTLSPHRVRITVEFTEQVLSISESMRQDVSQHVLLESSVTAHITRSSSIYSYSD